jgi:hypothetical protein
VVSLVALEPADAGDRRRAGAVGLAGGEGEVGAVRDQGEVLGAEAQLAPVLLDLEAGDGDELRGAGEQRSLDRSIASGGTSVW